MLNLSTGNPLITRGLDFGTILGTHTRLYQIVQQMGCHSGFHQSKGFTLSLTYRVLICCNRYL
jgi:hypothetical protein